MKKDIDVGGALQRYRRAIKEQGQPPSREIRRSMMCGTPDDTDAYWEAELEELARTEGPQIIDERVCPEDGQAYRAVCSVWEGRICYSVECAPLLKDGRLEDDWGTMGGCPGMHSTDFRTMEQAKTAWESLKALAGDEDAFWGWIDMGNRNFPALP